MRRLGSVLGLILVVGSGPAALADDDDGHKFRATLSGYNEVHFVTTVVAVPSTSPPATVNVLTSAALRGAISTGARGSFHATLHKNVAMIDYALSYEGLEGDVTQAHIHFGQRHTVGGIVVWLCQTAAAQAPTAVAGATPTCPGPRAGSVTGTITAAQVLTVVGQGFTAGEAGVFDELVRAIRAGATYANVHSQLFAPGEIRGHIDEREGHDH
jgi:hypothetical protein